MNGLKVLVVDDDPNVKEIIRLYFEKQLIQFVEASNGREAMAAVERDMPDIVVLDVMMPVMDGYETCRELNKMYDIPIIMLTAKGDEFDRVLGLELGADDYVTKPFDTEELLARVRASLRQRLASEAERQVVEAGPITIDLLRRTVWRDGAQVHLTPKEWDLLAELAKHPGRVLTHDYLLRTVWGPAHVGQTEYLRVAIRALRQKLEREPSRPELISNEPGVGYRLIG
jgi:two-component system KDP operon response regulator KdpE